MFLFKKVEESQGREESKSEARWRALLLPPLEGTIGLFPPWMRGPALFLPPMYLASSGVWSREVTLAYLFAFLGLQSFYENRPWIYRRLGMEALRLESLEELTRPDSLASVSPTHLVDLALGQLDAKRPGEALRALETLWQDPNWLAFRPDALRVGEAWYRLGRFDEATAAYRLTPVVPERDPEHTLRLAKLSRREGRVWEAQNLLQRLAMEGPDDLSRGLAHAHLASLGRDASPETPDRNLRHEENAQRLLKSGRGWRIYLAYRLKVAGRARWTDHRLLRTAEKEGLGAWIPGPAGAVSLD